MPAETRARVCSTGYAVTAARSVEPSTTLQNIVFAVMALVTLWRVSPISLPRFSLLLVAGFFVMGLKKPVWTLVAFLVAQLTITSYMLQTPFGTISLRLALLALVAVAVWKSIPQNGVKLGMGWKGVVIPTLIMIGISLFSNLTNSGFDFAMKDLRQMLVGLLTILLLPAVIRKEDELKTLCGVVFVVIVASAVIGVLQHYDIMGTRASTLVPGILNTKEPRVPGMTESELELAFVLSSAIPVILAIALQRGAPGFTRVVLLGALAFMALAVYFTYTRSAIFALIPATIALVVFSKTKVKGELVLVALLLSLAFFQFTGGDIGSLSGRSEYAQQESSMSRRLLWQAGIEITKDSPILGIGGDRFKSVSPNYSSRVDQSLARWQASYWSYRVLGTEQVHNDFLYLPVSYGVGALIVYLWLYFGILRNFLKSYRVASDPFVKWLSVGLAAALLAYAGNAFYHNMLITFPLFWILAAFSVTVAKLSLEKNVKPARID